MTYYVYVYFDPSKDLEPFYVGKGKGNRSHGHLTRVDTHPFTHRIQKMARQGVIPIIERYEGLSEEAALSLEVALIAEIGRKDLGKGTLLNLTDGGEGSSGLIHTKESKEKISKASKARPSNRKGKKLSEETKAKLAKAATGKRHTEESKKKMSENREYKGHSAEVRERISQTLKNKKKGNK